MGTMKDVRIDDSAVEREMEELGYEIDELGRQKAAAMRVLFAHGLYDEYNRELDKPSSVRAF